MIKKLQQKDNYTFTIEWTDGQINDYDLDFLQQNCPCANCIDESGKRKSHVKVRAHRIVSVGRYALRIYFNEGCSTGIYDFEMLRRLSKQSNESAS